MVHCKNCKTSLLSVSVITHRHSSLANLCEPLRNNLSIKPLCTTENRGAGEEMKAFDFACSCKEETLNGKNSQRASGKLCTCCSPGDFSKYKMKVTSVLFQAANSAEMSQTEKSLTLCCGEKNKTRCRLNRSIHAQVMDCP